MSISTTCKFPLYKPELPTQSKTHILRDLHLIDSNQSQLYIGLGLDSALP